MALRTWQLAFVLLACASVGPCARLAAQTPQIVLVAELPEELQRCVSAEQLQISLARESRRHQQQALELRVGLRVASADAGVTQLELTAATRERVLGTRVLPVRAADCAALPDTLALVLWLLSQTTEPAPPPPPSAATPAHDSELPPGQGPKPPPPTPSAVGLGLGLGAGAVLGVLPRAALQLQLSAELRAAFLDLRARLAMLWPQTQTIAEGRVSMSFYELALEACPRWQVARQPGLELGACAGPRLALLRSTSRGFLVENLPHTDVLVALAAAAEASLSLAEHTQLALELGVALALERPHYALQFQNAQPQRSLAGPALVRGEGSLSLVQMF